MTNVFPALIGQGWDITRAPEFKVRRQISVSGRETSIIDQSLPRYTWTLSYSILRDGNDTRYGNGSGNKTSTFNGVQIKDELRMIMGLFLACQGSLTPFLFNDPSDNSVTDQVIGTGDGTTNTFQLVRTMLWGFAEPIIAPNVVSNIKDNGTIISPSNYTVSSTSGLVQFTTPPAAGHTLTATFTYYFLCRFNDDTIDLNNFMYQFWELKQLKIKSILL